MRLVEDLYLLDLGCVVKCRGTVHDPAVFQNLLLHLGDGERSIGLKVDTVATDLNLVIDLIGRIGDECCVLQSVWLTVDRHFDVL